MTVNITSGGALSQMANAIKQAEMATKHRMHEEAKRRWTNALILMRDARRLAMEKNELHKQIREGR